jgi:hypothetical protein
MTTTPDGPQHLLDLTRLWVAIRRGRRLWLTFALLGLIGGGVLTVLMPPAPTAVVRVLVVHEEDGPADGGSLIRTDVALMTTSRIAGKALEAIKSPERPEDFVKEYEVVGLTNNIIEVTVQGDTGADAAKRAKALADAFIADHVGRIQAGAAAEAKAFTDQQNQVQAELDQVNGQISGAEAAAANNNQNNEETQDGQPPANAANLDSLYARRAELTNQIATLTQQAQEAGLGAPRVAAGTQIVDAPRPVKASLKATGVTNGGLGLVLGLVLGITFAAVGGVVRDKPVLRKDIAEHLGASVIAELPRRRRRILPGKKAEQTRKRVAATLVRLVREGDAPVSVLELGAPSLATSLAADVAAELAADRPVVLVGDVRNPPTETAYPVRVVGAEDTSAPRSGEARVGVGSVAPGSAWTDLSHLGAEALLVVKAGYANTIWLHTVARQLADTGIPIVGIVLADPDRRDMSDGTLWDGLHTALRGRVKQTRTNGTTANVHDLPTKRFAPVQSGKKEG